jgi:hypothetical protein
LHFYVIFVNIPLTYILSAAPLQSYNFHTLQSIGQPTLSDNNRLHYTIDIQIFTPIYLQKDQQPKPTRTPKIGTAHNIAIGFTAQPSRMFLPKNTPEYTKMATTNNY